MTREEECRFKIHIVSVFNKPDFLSTACVNKCSDCIVTYKTNKKEKENGKMYNRKEGISSTGN